MEETAELRSIDRDAHGKEVLDTPRDVEEARLAQKNVRKLVYHYTVS